MPRSREQQILTHFILSSDIFAKTHFSLKSFAKITHQPYQTHSRFIGTQDFVPLTRTPKITDADSRPTRSKVHHLRKQIILKLTQDSCILKLRSKANKKISSTSNTNIVFSTNFLLKETLAQQLDRV